jgi:hypothetical protein
MKHTSNLTRLDLNRICYAIGVHRHWQCLKDLLALCNISSQRYSWTYLNYQQNQCLSPLTFWIGTTYVVSSNPAKDKVYSIQQVIKFPGFLHQSTDRHDITQILLKVALNTLIIIVILANVSFGSKRIIRISKRIIPIRLFK